MFRSTLQRLSHWCGVAIVSRRHAGIQFLEHVPKTAFDLVLLHSFPDLRSLKFIQVGANDGRRADPLAAYLEPCSWSGLMFEPLAANYAALIRRHAGNPRLQIRRLAVDTVAGSRMMYDLDRVACSNLPDWAYGLGSFSRERVLTAAGELGLGEQAIVVEKIATVTWDDVWRDFGPGRCDLLVLDTEGYDLTLLRAAGLAQHHPRLIHFEHACVGLDDRLAFYRELIDLGYDLVTDGPDTTAWRKI